jgi:radical SAM protein with 4Fe4S-binding SPASM domain
VALGLLAGKGDRHMARELSAAFGVSHREALSQVRAFRVELAAKGICPSSPPKPLRRTPAIRRLFLHVTRQCNLSCPHCYYESGPGAAPHMDAERLRGLCRELVSLGGDQVTLSGGEPLLHPEFREIVSGLDGSLAVEVLTNGTLVDQGLAGLLSRKAARVQVSLDGSRPGIHDRIRGKGSFERAMAGIRALKQAGVEDLVLCATVTRGNVHDLGEIIALARELGSALVRFLAPRRLGRADSAWDALLPRGWPGSLDGFYLERFEEELFPPGPTRLSTGLSGVAIDVPAQCGDDRWCPIGTTLAVDSDGEAYPCAPLMHPEFHLGNVYREGIRAIQGSGRLSEVLAVMEERMERIPACRACPWRALCQGGCMAMALDHKGTVWDVDHHCAVRKEIYLRVFRRLAEGAEARRAATECG